MKEICIKNSVDIMAIPTKMGDFYFTKNKEYWIDRDIYLQLAKIYGKNIEVLGEREKEVSFEITNSAPFTEVKPRKKRRG